MGSFFNWAEYWKEHFKEELTSEEILKKVKQTEIYYWIYVLFAFILILVGVSKIFQSSSNNPQALFGLFLAVTGSIIILWNKLQMQIKLSMLYTIWIRNNQIEAEIRKSEAADL